MALDVTSPTSKIMPVFATHSVKIETNTVSKSQEERKKMVCYLKLHLFRHPRGTQKKNADLNVDLKGKHCLIISYQISLPLQLHSKLIELYSL